jgi:type I restriction enzyme S subunit
VKKREGTDVLETKINYSKTTQKEIKRDYKFSKMTQTTKVKFYDYNPYEDVKNLLVEVPIEKIVNNSYSLNYAEYMKDETEEEQYEDDVVVKTIGEIFNCKMGKFNSNDMDGNGIIPFYSCKSNNPVGFHSVYSFDYPEYLLLVCAGGSQNNIIGENVGMGKCYYVKGKTACMANVCSLVSKSQEYDIKYINYYLNINRLNTNKKAHFTTNLGRISLDDIKSIKIPIPTLDKQQEIVKYLDFIYEKANKTSSEKIAELKKLNVSALNMQKIFGENVMKTLGEVSKINYGKRITKSKDEGSEYFAYGGGDLMSYKVNEYNRDGITYKISRDGLSKHNCITKLYGKLFLNDTALTLDTLDDKSVNNYYIGEFLLSQKNYIYDNCTHGTAQLHIDINNLMKLKIPIPSLERQKEIVEYCEYNDTLIKQLEKEIENNKRLAQQFITGIIKAQVQTEDKNDICSVKTESIDDINSEILSEEELITELKPKVKKIVKNIVKKSSITSQQNQSVSATN